MKFNLNGSFINLPINIENLLMQKKVDSYQIEFKDGWIPNRIYRSIFTFANNLN